MEYRPHRYQEYATEMILETPQIGLFLEMGLGKTVSTLTAINALIFDYFEALRVLVIAPLRVAEHTWPGEVEKWNHLRHLKLSLVLGGVKQRRLALMEKADIYVINRENVDWLVTELGSKWDFDTVIVDELSSFKNHRAQRFKALRRVRPMIKRIIGLTGTPAPNGLLDLWSQIYLLDQGERLGKTVTGYRQRYFNPGKRNGHVIYDWQEKQEAEQRIYEAIGDITVSMKAEDWLELPERIDRVATVALSPSARALYQKLERDLLLPYKDADVVASTAAVLSNKLLQMASGAVYDEEKGVKLIHDAKLDVLEDLIEAANGKPVMVFYTFKHSLSRIQKRFPSARVLRKGAAGKVDIESWNRDRIPILLIHPKSAGHGLNLQESSCQTLIWFDQSWSLEENQQAVARVYRQGQKHRVVVIRLIAPGTLDEDVVKALSQKAAGQEALMQAVKARIGGVSS